MDSHLVSICIPVYNASRFISETIYSALNQSYKNIEIILVDDGSTDNSWIILQSFKEKYPQTIKIFRQQNKGACAARNIALNESKGDFIQWLDADDILAPQKIEIQVNFAVKNNNPFILHSSSFGIFYHRVKSARFFSNALWNDLNPAEWLYNHLKFGYYMFPAAWLVSKKLTEISGQWNEELSYNDDGEYFGRIISKCKFIKFHKDSICFYRKGSYNSLSRSLGKNTRSLISLHKSVNLICDYLLDINDNNDSREACIYALSKVCHQIKDALPEHYASNLRRIKYLGGEIVPPAFTTRYKFFRNIFGEDISNKIKSLLWNSKIMFEEKKELIESKFFDDVI